MLLLGLVLLVVVLAMAATIVRHHRERSPNCAGPPPLPLLGCSLEAAVHYPNMLDWMLGAAVAFDGCYQFKVLGQPNYIVVTDPECVKHVLKDNFDNYSKQFLRERSLELLGDGIFNADGAHWRQQRKTASHIFKRAELRGFMTEVFVEHARTLLARLDTYAQSGAEFDLQDLFYRYTLDSIGRIAFGVDLGCLTKESVPFATAFDTAQEICMLRLIDPTWSVRRWFKWLHPQDRALTAAVAVLDKVAMEVIEQRRRDGDADQREDLLSRFMALRDESGEPLSDSDLRDVVMSFIIAGRDTTANMLTWTFFELSRQPAIAAKLRAQLDAALPDRQPPTYSDISEQNLPYAHAVVQETLRLHPSVPKDGKTAVRRDVLPNGVVVPAASVVLYFPWGMGRMPSLWGADACQYRPERWLEGAPAPSDFKYIAFNAGPRLCLGKPMALLEGKILMSMILQRFDVIAAPNQEGRYIATLTLPMANGLRVRVRQRQD